MDVTARLAELERHLDGLMAGDVAWCRAKLRAAATRMARGQPADRILAQLEERARASRERVERRRAAVPRPTWDETLPITARREEIVAAIGEHQVIVVAGETGSGKTTQLPKLCLEAGRGVRGQVGCTQPRRIAARAMAERVSEELGTELGTAVGYQVRFRDRSDPDGYVRFMTDGILLAAIASDPDLTAYDTIIIDEAHERSLNIDFLIGYLHRLLPRRPDLKLIVTSATIDTEKFARHFGDCPVIEVSGRGYPVDIVYQPLDEDGAAADEPPEGKSLYNGIATAVDHLARIDPRGDILVFLAGEREIHEAADFLARRGLRHTEVLPLYARLSAGEQRRVFHPGPARRIILSTNVAETSLTVPRIRFVIDSGFARISRYAHRSRIQRLPIEPVSQASADQRAGRCGRLGPGTCVRLYAEDDYDSRPEFTEPEILRTSLASVILRMLTMGLGEVEAFPFIDPPAPRMIRDAYSLLFELGAIDEARAVTALGRRLADWPVDVRLARMIVEGEKQGCTEDLLALAAALSIQDPRERPLEAQAAADEAHGRFADEASDFAALLALFRHLRKLRRDLTGNAFRRRCRREFLNWQRTLEWFDLYQQLRDQAREARMALRGGHGDFEAVHRALLAGLLGQVGSKDPEGHGYTGPRGRQYWIFPGSGLFGKSPRWLMSAEIVETSKTYARTNARIDPAWIEEQGAHLLKYAHFDPHWSRRRGAVMAYRQVSLFGLVIVERRPVAYAAIDPAEARRIFILEALVRGELDTRAPFMRHNEQVRRDVERLEHKRRRRDVVADESAQFEFFDACVPEGVCTAKGFHDWLEGLSEAGRERLHLAHDVLLLEDAGTAPENSYPDRLALGDGALDLTYRFEPGHPEDGVTVRVPFERLNTLDPGRMQWLVPGLLREKVTELIRGLPKPLRRALTPPARFAEAALAEAPAQPREGLVPWLARRLSSLAGVDIAPEDFDERALPDHLRFRYVLEDAKGRVVAEGRDLEAMQVEHGHAARQRFMHRQGAGFTRDGETAWVFGELPKQWKTPSGATAWPGLVDQQDAVGLRLFDTAEEAATAHHAGVLRLLALAMPDKLRWLERHHGLRRATLARWSTVGSVAALVSDLARAALARTAGADTLGVRDEAAFDALVDGVRARVGSVFNAMARKLEETLVAWAEVDSALDDELARLRPEAWADLRTDLDDLVYDGFVGDLDPTRLDEYPRYLAALRHRLQTLDQNPVRDLERMAEVAPWWRRYAEHLEAGGVYDEAVDAYRWLIEEYRVSLFAQHLGTRQKVSPQRLEAAWRAVCG